MPSNRNRVGSHARNAVEELQLEAQTIGEQAQQRAHELSETARERARDMQYQIEDRIAQNPLKAVAVAAGVGALVGFLFRR